MMDSELSREIERVRVVSLETCLRRFEDFEPSEDCEVEEVVEVVNAYGVDGIGEYMALMLVNRTCFVRAGIVVVVSVREGPPGL